MGVDRRRLRILCSGAIVASLVAVRPASADAPPDRATCDAAYEQGQRLRRNKKLLEARERFVLCARDPCPSAFQGECARWLGEVSSELPTVVIEVRRRGELAPDARITLDGAPFQEKIDGVARPVDPGTHEFKVIAAGGTELVRRETVLEGVKAQRLVFDVEPVVGGDAPAKPTSTMPLVIGLGALGGVALVGFGYFGITGLSQRDEVERCSPECTRDQVDEAQRSLLLADVALGVAVVSLGAAAIIYLTRPATTPRAAAFDPLVLRW